MFSHLGKAFGQLGDPKILNVVLITLAISLVVMIALVWGMFYFINNTTFFETWPWSWGNYVLKVFGWFGALVVAWFLLPTFITLISSMFLETVSRAVEARHFPALPAPRGQAFATEILPELVKFTLIILLVNILAMPVYLLMAILLGLGFVVSWLVNGYLVGREYMEMVAMRRMPPREAKAFRKANGGSAFVAGFLIAVIMSVPFLNLLSPVIATAFMTHVFEDLRQRPLPAAPA